ncbi:MAG TPA: hypothetical protein VNA69_17085 [Thermoanaerobaculia bacterium]|nr:hypothetical protein [Thermoanaerobaculia bacterium]
MHFRGRDDAKGAFRHQEADTHTTPAGEEFHRIESGSAGDQPSSKVPVTRLGTEYVFVLLSGELYVAARLENDSADPRWIRDSISESRDTAPRSASYRMDPPNPCKRTRDVFNPNVQRRDQSYASLHTSISNSTELERYSSIGFLTYLYRFEFGDSLQRWLRRYGMLDRYLVPVDTMFKKSASSYSRDFPICGGRDLKNERGVKGGERSSDEAVFAKSCTTNNDTRSREMRRDQFRNEFGPAGLRESVRDVRPRLQLRRGVCHLVKRERYLRGRGIRDADDTVAPVRRGVVFD